MTYDIRKICENEDDLISQIARIHLEEIPAGFLTSLGGDILVSLYRTIAQSDGTFLVAAVSSKREVLGFLAGAMGTHSIYREFLRYRKLRSKIQLAIALMRPDRIYRMIETLKYSEDRVLEQETAKAEVLNFCVARQGQRLGLGTKLMATAEMEFAEGGARHVRIVTGSSQKSALRFYRKIGANEIGEVIVHKGTPSIVFLWSVGLSASDSASEENCKADEPAIPTNRLRGHEANR